MRGHNDCLLPTEIEVSPSTALQSAHLFMGLVLCLSDFSRLLEIDHSVWKQSYNACTTVLYSIDIGWPYDMRPSVRAEKYIRDASG